jgi:hypothetical protein
MMNVAKQNLIINPPNFNSKMLRKVRLTLQNQELIPL